MYSDSNVRRSDLLWVEVSISKSPWVNLWSASSEWFRIAENGGLLKRKPVLVEIPIWPQILWEIHWVDDPMYLAVQQGQENKYTTFDVRSNGFSLGFFSSDEMVKSFENTILKSICGKLCLSAFKSCFLIVNIEGK